MDYFQRQFPTCRLCPHFRLDNVQVFEDRKVWCDNADKSLAHECEKPEQVIEQPEWCPLKRKDEQ